MKKPKSVKQVAYLLVWLPVMLLIITACGNEATNPTNTAFAPVDQTSPTTNATTGSGSGTPQVAAAATDTPAATATATTATNTPQATPSLAPAIQGINGQTVPDFPGLKPAQPGQPLEQRFESQLVGAGGGNATARFFTTTAKFEEIVSYYDKQLAAAGFTKEGQQNLNAVGNLRLMNGAIVGYNLGGANPKRVALVNAGPITDNFISQLNTAELTAFNLPRGENLIIILENVPVGLG
jgi:hypothetical protein